MGGGGGGGLLRLLSAAADGQSAIDVMMTLICHPTLVEATTILQPTQLFLRLAVRSSIVVATITILSTPKKNLQQLCVVFVGNAPTVYHQLKSRFERILYYCYYTL